MDKSKFCMFCGQIINEDALYCSLCGKEQSVRKRSDRKPEQQVSAAVQEKVENVTDTMKTALTDVSQKAQGTDWADKAKKAAKSATDHMKEAAKQDDGTAKTKRRKKKSAELFEAETFENKSAAQEFLDKNAAKMKRSQIGLIAAVISSVFGVLYFMIAFGGASSSSFIRDMEGVFGLIAIIGSFISYVLTGGILNSLRYSFRIAKFGWFIIPAFPFDLMLGAIALILAIFTFLLIPIVSVGINYVQTKKNIEAADLLVHVLQESERV